MTTMLTLLEEGVEPGAVFTAVVLLLIGLLGLWQGWVAYTEPTPRFVLNYRGWSCPPLAMLYGGIFMICMGIVGFQPPLPRIVGGLIALVWLFCGVTLISGFFFWFPPFLVPRWYHRARKAGVPRHDINAMAAFKALPVDQQKQAAQQRQL